AGKYVCAPDQLGVVCDAVPGTPAASEICGNGIDDNCNGVADEGYEAVGMPCMAGGGACLAFGHFQCGPDLHSIVCDAVPGTRGAEELCNGIDDNCNGEIDETFFALHTPCTVGKGICERTGSFICSADGKSLVCDALPGQPGDMELCGNGLDDDCNGEI